MDELAFLRRLLAESPPSEEAEVVARRLLRAEIARELERRARNRDWRPLLVAAGVVALVVGVMGVSRLFTPSPAAAALTELARVAEHLPTTELPPGSYAYTRSEQVNLVQLTGIDLPGIEEKQVSFLLPETREVWVGAEGARRIRTTVGEPRFFSDEVEAAFGAASLAEDYGVGQTTVEVLDSAESDTDLSSWPTDPQALEAAMRAAGSQRATDVPEPARLLEVAIGLLKETETSPELRAAVLRVLASYLPRPEVVDGEATTMVEISFTYQSEGTGYRRSLWFEAATARLVVERLEVLDPMPSQGIPAGTVVSEAHYQPTVLVDAPGGLP